MHEWPENWTCDTDFGPSFLFRLAGLNDGGFARSGRDDHCDFRSRDTVFTRPLWSVAEDVGFDAGGSLVSYQGLAENPPRNNWFSSTAGHGQIHVMTVIKITTTRNQYNIVMVNPPTSKLQYFRWVCFRRHYVRLFFPPHTRTHIRQWRDNNNTNVRASSGFADFRNGIVWRVCVVQNPKLILNFTVRRPRSDFNECVDKRQVVKITLSLRVRDSGLLIKHSFVLFVYRAVSYRLCVVRVYCHMTTYALYQVVWGPHTNKLGKEKNHLWVPFICISKLWIDEQKEEKRFL